MFRPAALAALLAATACASARERVLRDELRRTLDQPVPSGTTSASFDGSAGGYAMFAALTSPRVRAALHAWEAAAHEIDTATALEDPMFSYSISPFADMRQHRFALVQRLPWPGRLAASEDAAVERARAAQSMYEVEVLEAQAHALESYWMLWRNHRSQVVLADAVVLLSTLVADTRRRITVGAARVADVSLLELEEIKAREQLDTLLEERQALGAALSEALGLPELMDPPTTPAPPSVTLPVQTLGELVRLADSAPEVAARRAELEAEEHDASATSQSWVPDLTVGVEHRRPGELMDAHEPAEAGMTMLMVGVDLPIWWGTYAAQRDAARARRGMAEEQLRAEQVRARANVRRSYAQLRDALRRVERYRERLLPKARDAYEARRIGLETGEVSVGEVLLVRRDLLELELAFIEAQAEVGINHVRLEHVLGHHAGAQP